MKTIFPSFITISDVFVKIRQNAQPCPIFFTLPINEHGA